MTIRTVLLGGTDWVDGQVLYAADLNDTFNAVPHTINLPAHHYTSIITGAWAIPVWAVGYIMGVELYNGNHNQNDEIEFTIPASFVIPGTYKMIVVYATGPAGGIVTLSIDGVSKLVLDEYTVAAYTSNVISITTGIVLTATDHAIRWKVTDKNAGSANHYGYLSGFVFIRTGV